MRSKSWPIGWANVLLTCLVRQFATEAMANRRAKLATGETKLASGDFSSYLVRSFDCFTPIQIPCTRIPVHLYAVIAVLCLQMQRMPKLGMLSLISKSNFVFRKSRMATFYLYSYL